MKTYNDYNESNKRTPPIFPDYVVEAVLDGDDESIDVSHFTFQDSAGRVVGVYANEQ